MKYTEELLWILDKPGTTIHNQDEKYRENIAFVHSLGLKCDCVGWCKLDLADSGVGEVFEKISAFCKDNGWKARCLYTRKLAETDSDWFELVTAFFRDNTPADRIETATQTGGKMYTRVIRAFHEMSPAPKTWGGELFLPERFRDFCVRSGIDDLDFCWAKDKGKYQAEQYFHAYGKRLVPAMAVDFALNESGRKGLPEAGGWLPEIARVFHTLQQINLPDCYLRKDLPAGGIAYVHIPSGYFAPRKNTLLIHRDLAQTLLKQKVIPAGTLRPAPVVEELPGGYALAQTAPIPRPSRAFMEQMNLEYEALIRTDRPVRTVTEKEALKLLRSTKKDRKADFRKALPKSKALELSASEYAPVLPYYAVADGGYLSDEYELLPHDRAITENDGFRQSLEAEELLAEKPQGVVIAKCPDGDLILLCSNGGVIRFSHESPEVTEEWPSLAQFVVDAVND